MALSGLKNALRFRLGRYDRPLLKYLSFRIEGEGQEGFFSKRNTLLIFTFSLFVAILSFFLIEHFLLAATEPMSLVDTSKHAVLEIFCALISLIVGFILLWEYSVSGQWNTFLLTLAFFSMGILDIFHAFSDYNHNMFVWFHSFSALFGSVFLLGAVFIDSGAEDAGNTLQSVWARRFIVFFGIFVIFAFAISSIKWDSIIPEVLEMRPELSDISVIYAEGHFSDFIYAINLITSVFFLIAAIILIRGFLKSNDIIYQIFGTFALLFFESEFFFTFSRLWDPIWWFWHVIKVVVFSGLLIGLAYGFSKSVFALHVSRAKLAKILTELEDKNIEIGRAYERLKETQRYLSESEKLASIGKMSAGIAHELRNPMGAIANSLSVLKRYNSLEREDVELVKIVEDEMGRLNKLLEDFLNYSKPSRLDYRETDLHRLIDDAISVFQLNKSLNGIIVEKKYAQKIPLLNLDRDKIKQMLLNLFINAMQAMPEGGTLTIETQYKTSEDEVQLAVSDTGSGMSDEILSQIFQPFFTTKDKGLGLGLSIVHKIMKEHGGYVLISSEIGKGTKIELKFPVKFMKDPVGLSDTEGRSEAGSTEGGYGENIGG